MARCKHTFVSLPLGVIRHLKWIQRKTGMSYSQVTRVIVMDWLGCNTTGIVLPRRRTAKHAS